MSRMAYIDEPLTPAHRHQLRLAAEAGELEHGFYVRWHTVELPVEVLKRIGLRYRLVQQRHAA